MLMSGDFLTNAETREVTSGRLTSKMSMEGWWMVHTTVRPVSTVFLTVRITMAAARASRPDVGSYTSSHATSVQIRSLA